MGRKRITDKRICSNCGADSTYIYTDKRGWIHTRWTKYGNGFLCKKCRCNLIDNPRRVLFGKKIVYVKKKPREGKCKSCGKSIGDYYIDHNGKRAIIKFTHIHHEQYDRLEPLKYTKELCQSCHGKLKKGRKNRKR